MSAPSNRQEVPVPHRDWAGQSEVDAPAGRSIAKRARLWRPLRTILEPLACTLARYALRVIDRNTGIPYSADELEAKILAQAGGSATTDTLGTEPADGDAPAGRLGEFILTNANDFLALVSDETTSIASLELTPGDWELEGMMLLNGGPGASVTQLTAAFSDDPGVVPGYLDTYYRTIPFPDFFGLFPIQLLRKRFALAEPTTIHFVAHHIFSGGTVSVTYLTMTARRVR